MEQIIKMENIIWNSPCPILAIDIVIFTIYNNELSVILTSPTYMKKWFYYLPWNIVLKWKSLEQSFDEILEDKTWIKWVYKEQLYAFWDPSRDPKWHWVTIAYIALVEINDFYEKIDFNKVNIIKYSDIENINFWYDHKEIIKFAKNRLDKNILHSDVAKHIMPKYFRISELHKTYEIILWKKMDLRNFQKKILALWFIKDTGLKDKTIKAPARLFEFIDIESE